ncbi:MAG: hypothetical protein AB1810_14770 [Pseudomonadota bacterium]
MAEVPAEKFTNWAGDFANVEAAQEYASVAGIPKGERVTLR